MRILGIDPSVRSCGVVVIENNDVLHSCTFGGSIESKTENEKIKRMLKIAQGILKVGVEYQIDVIAIEGLAMKQHGSGMGNQLVLAELFGIIKSNIWMKFKKEPMIIPPASWKKQIIENGRAKKDEVQRVLTDKGYILNKQDEYDALGIALCAQKFLNKEVVA